MSVQKFSGWGREVDSGAWQDVFSITTGADDLSMVSAKSSRDTSGNKVTVATVVYNGSGAITLGNYDGLPTGSLIIDVNAFKIHIKIAGGWKSSAAFSTP